MGEFSDVTIVMAANVYFDGGVTSRTIKFSDGSTKTLGFMQVGEYQFNTDKKEHMDILLGEVDVLLAGETEWKRYKKGDTFYIDANSTFKINAISLTDYCCSFID